jgi:hypothetical protein
MPDLELNLRCVWRTVLQAGMCGTERNMKKHNSFDCSLHGSGQYQEPLSSRVRVAKADELESAAIIAGRGVAACERGSPGG